MDPSLPIACIFRSTRTDHSEADYQAWSERMEHLVVTTPGYQSHVSLRDRETREGVTIAYFDDLESIALWRDQADHVLAQQLGRERFYEDYVVEIAPVVREYRWRRPLHSDDDRT
jgi:heme-degrading monooxygenase HmoA